MIPASTLPVTGGAVAATVAHTVGKKAAQQAPADTSAQTRKVIAYVVAFAVIALGIYLTPMLVRRKRTQQDVIAGMIIGGLWPLGMKAAEAGRTQAVKMLGVDSMAGKLLMVEKEVVTTDVV